MKWSFLVLIFCLCFPFWVEADTLTLSRAETIALANHPKIKAGVLQEQVGETQVKETHAAELPFVSGNLTGVDAEAGSRISAGGLNNPLIFSRYANGLSLNQLITDFGHTHDLVQSSVFHQKALQTDLEFTRLEVLFQADDAYFSVLRTQALLEVAKETVAERQSVLDQVNALAKSKLKSGLDLSFAEVNLAQSKLFLVQAQNDLDAAYMTLSTALGYSELQRFSLVDEMPYTKPPGNLGDLTALAFQTREDLTTLLLERASAEWYAKAQGAQSLPRIDLAGALGESPYHAPGLSNSYSVIGINVDIPIFNGNLFSEEEKEAQLKVGIEDQNVQNLKNQIAHDVGVAWLDVETAYQNLALTQKLRRQAAEALDLAQARYNLGLSSIVELSHAQLNLTQAEIDKTNAKYAYEVKVLSLDYQVGVKK